VAVATDEGSAGGLPVGTGLVLDTAGVGTIALPGVDYSKGPWKLFSTVRLAAAAQTLSIPVVDGEGNGIIRATGRIISDGTARNVSLKINGSATGVTGVQLFGNGSAASSAFSLVQDGTVFCAFELTMLTAKRAAGLRRFISINAAAESANPMVWRAAAVYFDNTTIITSIDLDCGFATGFAIGTEVLVEEGIVS
jgi:hypothetical protein